MRILFYPHDDAMKKNIFVVKEVSRIEKHWDGRLRVDNLVFQFTPLLLPIWGTVENVIETVFETGKLDLILLGVPEIII